ncbi:hypothetical protein [Streptomyces hundungensis]|uniref:hypothetical protein n=1 Tax=Streptomyces hundungensis TaxID=1077946 RepID=UPI0033CE76CC
MHRGLVHGLAWSLATGAAVTLSWWGVHTVMAGTAYDPPRALPISGDARIDQGSRPDASSTRRPRESPSPSSSASTKPPKDATSEKPSGGHSSSPGSSSGTTKSASMSGTSGTSDDSADSGAVRGYNVAGGRVVFDLGNSSAQLVSATPASGWRMERWIQTQWIRVTFTRGSETVSVFCTWNGHPPMVEINNT